MPAKVFIDGEAGTTGLQIRECLAGRPDLELVRLDEAVRKDPAARRDALNTSDVAILCLPDEAAREAVSMIEADTVRVIDASTAHRADPAWAFGFPEMTAGQAERIASATRVSNPGCYSTGAIALVRPLVEAGLLPPTYPVSVSAVSGYSGGGRKMIEEFEGPGEETPPFHLYALTLAHKHLPEMQAHGLLRHRPIFQPSVGRFRQGMLVSVPLALWSLPKTVLADRLHAALAEQYAGQPFVEVAPLAEAAGLARLDPRDLNGTNRLRIYVFANPTLEQAVLVAQLDNLGKGASGAAVQNLNLMLGLSAESGLDRLAA